MKTLMVTLLALAATVAFAKGRTAPVYIGTIAVTEKHSMDDIEKVIKKALIGRGWQIEESHKGVIHAKVLVRRHIAKIQITFDRKKITLDYVDSVNLNYAEKGGEKYIHTTYNRWIQTLERDIQFHLA